MEESYSTTTVTKRGCGGLDRSLAKNKICCGEDRRRLFPTSAKNLRSPTHGGEHVLQYPSDATGRPPGHVRTPDDFMYWFREQWSLRALGDVDIHAVDLFDEDGQATGVVIDRCRHRVLWSGLSLTLAWDVAVGGDGLFVPVSYSFDFRNGYTDELIVRYDMHPGHPTIGDVHVHLDDSEDEPLHSHQVTLFEAYDAVQWHLELRGSLRP